jgi:hypothetical protein
VRIKACIIAALVPIVAILIALVAATTPFAPSPANATPGFARQTGISCQACHTVFPELTPFGRKFKLNAYVFTNVTQLQATNDTGQQTLAISNVPPLSVMVQASNTTLAKALPDPDVPNAVSQKNDTEFPQALSLFYTGKIADNLGAFLQLTWEPGSNALGIDNCDLRFANHASFESIGDVIYGITLNNNPTSQDVWNSTPAWGYPFVASGVGVGPTAGVLLDGQFGQASVGLGAYAYLFDHLYLEMSGYRSALTEFANATTDGPGPLDSTAPDFRIASAAAAYWRAVWEQDWDSHALSVGTYGMSTRTRPSGIGEDGPADKITDAGLDAQYQYISDAHIVSVATTWIHEKRTANNMEFAMLGSGTLDTERLTGSYFFKRKVGGLVQLFSTTGSADTTLYAGGEPAVGSANGLPDTRGALFEIDYLPWLNTKLGLQYTLYSKFNGQSSNYDGFGRDASDNNLWYAYIWTAF